VNGPFALWENSSSRAFGICTSTLGRLQKTGSRSEVAGGAAMDAEFALHEELALVVEAGLVAGGCTEGGYLVDAHPLMAIRNTRAHAGGLAASSGR